MSFILNIDSSVENASVSIAENGVVLRQLQNNIQKDHAAFLHAAVKKLTIESGFPMQNIDAFAVTTGPGSYTGLRVGLSAAKGFSYALSKPLITVSTLEAIAAQAISGQVSPEDFYYCPMIDARRMEVFTALYNADMQELTAPLALVLQEDSFSFELKDKAILFVGNGSEKWKALTKNRHAFFAPMPDITQAISQISHDKYLAGTFADLALSAPLYIKEFFDGR